MWSRLGAGLALLTGMFVLASPLAAGAEEPVDLGGAYVVDTVGALSGREAEVQAALDDLYAQADIQLFVVYVDSFENPSDGVEWADRVAIENNLGTRDLLLAVATGERSYALSVDNAFPLTDAQLDAVERDIESYLVDDDWAGAVIGAVDSLKAESGVGGGVPILPIVGGVAVVGAGVFIFSRIRKRSKEGKVTANPDGMTQKELDQRAGSLLVQLDDSLKTSEQELGFAVAQFGDAATADFTATLAAAKEKVAQAFAIRQQLDDVNPETSEQKRTLTTQIIQLCESADADLDAQADAFDALRSLEKNAPEALAAVRKDAAAAATARADAAGVPHRTHLDLRPGRGQARRGQPRAGRQAAGLRGGQLRRMPTRPSSTASRATPRSRCAPRRRASARSASCSLRSRRSRRTSRMPRRSSTPSWPTPRRTSPPHARSPTTRGSRPRSPRPRPPWPSAASAKGDPVAALEHLTQANAALDQVFTGVRSEQEKVERAKSQLDATLSGARAQVQAAAEFITTRRGGVGSDARTRVSEADRHLAAGDRAVGDRSGAGARRGAVGAAARRATRSPRRATTSNTSRRNSTRASTTTTATAPTAPTSAASSATCSAAAATAPAGAAAAGSSGGGGGSSSQLELPTLIAQFALQQLRRQLAQFQSQLEPQQWWRPQPRR